MNYRFNEYSCEAFESEPERMRLDGRTCSYLSFRAEARETAPVVFLGGAFQSFASFKREVHGLMRHRPVILLELPGQGRSLETGAGLSFADLADLLATFVRRRGLDRIALAGCSYGSAIGYAFAARYPELCEQLILAGTTPALRPPVRRVIRSSLEHMQRGDMKRFARLCVDQLFNTRYAERTGVSLELTETLARRLERLTALEREKHRVNSERILAASATGLSGHPLCPTLVLTAEFDHFTTPRENYRVAARCARSVFAVVADGDHMAGVTRPGLLTRLYAEFLDTGTISGVPRGVRRVEHINGPLEGDSLERRNARTSSRPGVVRPGSLASARRAGVDSRV